MGAASLSACAPSTAEGTQNTDPLPSATVAAPDGGTTDDIVESAPASPVVEIGLSDPAVLATGMTVSVAGVDLLDVAAETPGEIAGPAVALTLTFQNDSDEPIDLSTAMISVTSAVGSLGQPTTSTPYAPYLGTLASGESASGVYVFLLPAAERDSLSISVEYVAGAPIALFVGEIQ